MALNIKSLRMLKPYLSNARILCLGYPDLVCSKEKLKEIFDIDVEAKTDRGRWHTGIDQSLPETQEFFTKLGSTIEVVDIVEDFGIEKVVDLNYPQDLGKFDLVIDPGTIEHCFNIGQAIINAANAVKVGGHIFHVPPMTMLNHGFYNICPTLLNDFYGQNEWDVEVLASFGRSGRVDIERILRFEASTEASLYCIAKRKNDAPLKFPVQAKYLIKMHKDKNAKRAA